MMFPFICDLTIKATILLLMSTALSLALRRCSAAARHRLWGLTMLGLLGLPLLPFVTPAIWSLTVPSNVSGFIPSVIARHPSAMTASGESRIVAPAFLPTNPVAVIPEHSSVTASVEPVASSAVNVAAAPSSSISRDSVAALIPIVWAVGTSLILLNLAVGTYRVVRFRKASRPVSDSVWQCLADELHHRLGLTRIVELLEHPGNIVPLTLGVIRPAVVLPQLAGMWTQRLKRSVLLHELAHVRRRDVACQWLGRLACALFWFHPLAWWGLHKLRQEREKACDDLVVHCGERATEYAEDLVLVARSFKTQHGLACGVAMAKHGNLETRIRSLFDVDVVRSHAPLSKLFALALLLLVAVIAVSVSAIQLAAQVKDDREADVPHPASASATSSAMPIRFGIPDSDEASDNDRRYDEQYDEVGNHRDRRPGPLKHTVTVLSDEGEPVVGARIFPRGFGTANGAGWAWLNDFWPKEFSTNVDGEAVILVPEEQAALIPLNSGNFSFVAFTVEHPDFARVAKSFVNLGDKAPIRLSRGVVIAPRAVNAATKQLITSDLYAVSSGYPTSAWVRHDTELRSAPVDPTDSETGMFFRVIHAPLDPPDSPVLFSDVMNITTIEVVDHVARVDAHLYPGLRLSGTLSADVPRPVRNGGHVVASIQSGGVADNGVLDHSSGLRQKVGWGDVANIDTDGNFEFPYLPRASHVELIAVCDGWVSKAKSEDLAEYDRIHQTGFQTLNSNSSVASTPVFIDRENVTITLEMVRMGSCEVLVEDEHGTPLDLATVNFMPNHQTRAGGSGLANGGRSLDDLRNPDSQIPGVWTNHRSQYVRTTGTDGRALISNLPAERQIFHVLYPGYRMPHHPHLPRGHAMGVADIQSGQTTKLTVRMIPDNTDGASPVQRLFAARGSLPIHLSVVDAKGVPLPGVRVTPRAQNLQNPDERQSWPSEWPGEITTDMNGVAKLQVHIPANLSPDSGPKISIWFDADCPGYVPLTNQKSSLTRQLPIRMMRM